MGWKWSQKGSTGLTSIRFLVELFRNYQINKYISICSKFTINLSNENKIIKTDGKQTFVKLLYIIYHRIYPRRITMQF